MNSEMSNSDFVARLKTLMGTEKPYPWAASLGIAQATFNRMWKEGWIPKGETLLLISEKTGCSIDWLLTGSGPKKRGEPGNTFASAPVTQYANADELGKNYVLVPRFDVKASAGGGSLIHSEQVVDHLVFKLEWVNRALGVSPKHLALISVKGDSMEPTLSDGDLVLIDTSAGNIENNAIYVLQYNGTLLVKRIQKKLDGSVLIISDNSMYKQEVLTGDLAAQLNVIGRVVWSGRRM